MPEPPPPLPPRNRNHEGEIIRVAVRARTPCSGRITSRRRLPNTNPTHHRDAPPEAGPNEAVAVGREGDGDDRSTMSAASSISALTMGTARPHRPAHRVPKVEANHNRAKSQSKAAVIGRDYDGSGSAVGINIDIDIPATCKDGGVAGTSRRNAAQRNQDACMRDSGNRNRHRPAGAAAAAASHGTRGSRSERVRPGRSAAAPARATAAALPILEEGSDSSDTNGGNNANHSHSHGGAPPSESTSPHRPRSGRHLLRDHASSVSGSTSTPPYVTDIGYSDDDARHTLPVASQRPTLWDQLGLGLGAEERRAARRRRREGERWEGEAAAAAAAANSACATNCCGRNAFTTATSKRMVGVGLLLLSAVMVIACAVGYRNSRSGSSQPNQRQQGGGGGGGGPGLGGRPLEEDGAIPAATGAWTPTAAPTPWTVPAFQPTVPVGSSPHICSTSPIHQLVTDGIQSDDKLGTSVAMDRAGTIVVAGAPNADNLGSHAAGIASLDTGAVFVYELHVRANGGDMQDVTQVTKLVASDSVRGMGFGTSVDISDDGNVIVIGAPSVDVNFIDKVGAAYVFRRDSDGIFREEARLVPTVSITRMQFGRSVAINEDGTRIVVGAPGGRRIANGSVTVFAYEATGESDGGWAYTTHVQDDTSDESMFGLSVDISNNNIVIGAPLAGFQMEGAAYLHSGDAAWEEVAMFSGLDGRDEFGVDVSIDRDRIAIGSQFANTQFGYNSGSVHLYTKNSANDRWEPEVQISRVGMVTQGYKFGNSVDLTGSRLIAGAPGNSAAYVFTFEEDAWKETQRMEHSGGSFGTSVAVSSGATIAVGDPSQDENAGATFVIDNCHV